MRAAAVGGVAYMGSKAGARKANEQAAQQQAYQEPAPVYQQPAPAPPADNSSDRIGELKQLAELHDSGVLTDEEFAREKTRILG
jgi:Short C-terminal domain